jgi:hypothetical protein
MRTCKCFNVYIYIYILYSWDFKLYLFAWNNNVKVVTLNFKFEFSFTVLLLSRFWEILGQRCNISLVVYACIIRIKVFFFLINDLHKNRLNYCIIVVSYRCVHKKSSQDYNLQQHWTSGFDNLKQKYDTYTQNLE